MTTLSLTGAPFNVKVRQGASFGPYTVTARYKGSSTPVDLTGVTISCQVRESANSPAAAAEVTCTVLDAAAGTFTIYMADETTALLAVGDYKWDLILEDADGEVRPWWKGTFTVSERITR